MSWTPEQQAANRRLWVEALRSGKYPQGNGFLNDSGKFCCLGVACEIASENGVKLEKHTATSAVNRVLYNGSGQFPPPPVQDWLGLTDETGILRGDAPLKYATLVGANDDGTSFEEIANFIEKGYVCVTGH